MTKTKNDLLTLENYTERYAPINVIKQICRVLKPILNERKQDLVKKITQKMQIELQ